MITRRANTVESALLSPFSARPGSRWARRFWFAAQRTLWCDIVGRGNRRAIAQLKILPGGGLSACLAGRTNRIVSLFPGPAILPVSCIRDSTVSRRCRSNYSGPEVSLSEPDAPGGLAAPQIRRGRRKKASSCSSGRLAAARPRFAGASSTNSIPPATIRARSSHAYHRGRDASRHPVRTRRNPGRFRANMIWSRRSTGTLLHRIERGRDIVLVIDEAQNLSFEVLEQIGCFRTWRPTNRNYCRSCLIGQPELKKMLAQESVAGSCGSGFWSTPSCAPRAPRHHPLCPAPPDPRGRQWPPVLYDGGAAVLHRFSRGIPRVITTSATRRLLSAFVRDSDEVNYWDVRRANQRGLQSRLNCGIAAHASNHQKTLATTPNEPDQ